MAALTKAAFLSKWNSLFADNATRDISEEDLRDFRQDISDSFLGLSDNFIDEDSFASDSATKVPSQQSVKAYVDANAGGSQSVNLYARIFEDFDVGVIGYFSSSAFNNGGGLGGTASPSTFGQDGTEQAIGVLDCLTGSSTAGGNALANSTFRHTLGFGATHTITYRAALSALSDGTNTYTVRLGFMNAYTTTAAATNGVYFRYTHGTNTGKWEAVTVSSGTETATDTGITATAGSTFSIFKIVVNSDATSVAFYIDGVLVATNTTNIPTGTGLTVGQAAVIEKTAGSTSRSLYLDYAEKITERSTAR